jgi:N-acetyl sugar amidotransferase
MDTSDVEIIFDDDGICNHCSNALEHLSQPPYGLESNKKIEALNNLIQEIKNNGKRKKYDCVIGLSGGVDSSYLAFLVKQWGLRPIAVHLDNFWNSNIAEKNISNIYKVLGFDEKRKRVNWNEFKDLQLAFLRASVPDLEIPSDNGINALLWDTAKEYKIKYILAGTNITSESILPRLYSQGHVDKVYIRSIHKQFGKIGKLSFHILSSWEVLKYIKFDKINFIPVLNYIDYDKEKAKVIIQKELGWKDYGRKHGESTYTRIVQEYILPIKFGIDKRKAHLSSLIISGQITRDEALKKLMEPLYANEQDIQCDIELLCKKFEITKNDFIRIMALPKRSMDDYPNENKAFSYKILNVLRSIYRFLKNHIIKKITG